MRNLKNQIAVPKKILDAILEHGAAVESAMPHGALCTLDALER